MQSQIQQCVLEAGGRLRYLNTAGFKKGEQDKSISRILSKGIRPVSGCIKVRGREILVFMVVATDVSNWQPYLQKLARTKQFLRGTSVDVWLDVRNDTLWTLSEDNQKILLSILQNIKK